MTDGKHDKGKSLFQSDLDRNPGIGQSKGAFTTGEDPGELEGENTMEGDVENDATAVGGATERKLGHTNR